MTTSSSPSWISFSPDIVSSPHPPSLSPSTPTSTKYRRPKPPTSYKLSAPTSLPRITAPPAQLKKAVLESRSGSESDDSEIDELVLTRTKSRILLSPVDPFDSTRYSPTNSDTPSTSTSPSNYSLASNEPTTPIDILSPPLHDPLVAHFSSSLESSVSSIEDSNWDEFYSSLSTAVPRSHFPLTPAATATPRTSKHPYSYSSTRRGSVISSYSYGRRSSITVVLPSYATGNGNGSPRKSAPPSPILRRSRSRRSISGPGSPVTPRLGSSKLLRSHSKAKSPREKEEKARLRREKKERDRMPMRTKDGFEIDPLDWFFGVTPEMGKAIRGGYSNVDVRDKWKKEEDFEGLLRAESDSETGKKERHRPPPLDLSRSRSTSISSSSSYITEIDSPLHSAKTIDTPGFGGVISPDPISKEIRRRASEAALRSNMRGRGKGKSLGIKLKEFWSGREREREKVGKGRAGEEGL